MDKIGAEREAQRLAKAHATRLETIRKERIRVKWGLPQQTKMKIGHNRHHAYIRSYLRKRGYIIPDRGGYVAYFDISTNRGALAEKRAIQNGFTIMEYGQYQQ